MFTDDCSEPGQYADTGGESAEFVSVFDFEDVSDAISRDHGAAFRNFSGGNRDFVSASKAGVGGNKTGLADRTEQERAVRSKNRIGKWHFGSVVCMQSAFGISYLTMADPTGSHTACLCWYFAALQRGLSAAPGRLWLDADVCGILCIHRKYGTDGSSTGASCKSSAREGTAVVLYLQSGHQQCSRSDFAFRIYRSVRSAAAGREHWRTRYLDCIPGKLDLV